jgi:hypothetical protein
MIAGSLFHFTKETNTLLKIIEGKSFKASYNIEKISDFYPLKKFLGIPMVCFCDIPLKFITEHTNKYGLFGLGLNKKWGINNGINPIQYRIKDCSINNSWREIITVIDHYENFEHASQFIPNDDPVLTNFIRIKGEIIKITNFSKEYENSDSSIYYTEREWRYIPPGSEFTFVDSFESSEREKLNKKYKADYLDFKVEDVKYIIVPDRKQGQLFVERLFQTHLSDDEKNYLSQMIIDLESIKIDF